MHRHALRILILPFLPAVLSASGCGGSDVEPGTRESRSDLQLVMQSPELLVRHDYQRRTAFELAEESVSELSPSSTTDLGAEDGSPTALSFGGYEVIQNPASAPAWRNVHLSGKFPDGEPVGCSGTLIDSRHVLTAAHCVHLLARGGWADLTSIGVPQMPTSAAITAVSFNGWVKDQSYDYDMAIVYINRPLGAATDWAGYGTATCAHLTDPAVTYYNYSYPSAGPHSGKVVRQVGRFDSCTTGQAKTNSTAYKGQSGSTFYELVNGKPVVRAVFSNFQGVGQSGSPSYATRVRDFAVTLFNDQIAEHRGSEADLMVYRPLVGQTEIDISESTTLSGVKFYVHNYSKVDWSGKLQATILLSSDGVISASDIKIGTYSALTSIDSMKTLVVTMPAGSVKVPAWLAPGTYRVGVQITADDADATNNITPGIGESPKLVVKK